MRVTDNTNYGVVRDSISRSRGRMENLQMESATLKKLNRPSDDPVGAAKVLEVRTDKVNNEQFQVNAKLAQAFLDNTDHALDEISEIVMRAKEIAINQSSNASSTPESRLGVSEEVSQLFQRAVATGNRRIGDRYIFGGFKSTTAPVDGDGNYRGDDGEIMIEVGREVFIGANVPGYEVFNTHPDGSTDKHRLKSGSEEQADRRLATVPAGPQNVNLFQQLKALRTGLLTGDIETIRGTLDSFDDLLGKVISTRAKIGARIQSIEGNMTALDRHNVTNAQLTSSIEDADMTQVVSDLAKEETVFKSSLASSKHLIQPTLLDFLR
ncbi:MAG: flagellar hook-associated protein FlgL [Bdellovibrionales bacterium]|nr:flagellar hook-associated protein FlgL [Bdellovibrionales bacterium]